MFFQGKPGPEPTKIHQNLTTDAEFRGDVDFIGFRIDVFDKSNEKHENTEILDLWKIREKSYRKSYRKPIENR